MSQIPELMGGRALEHNAPFESGKGISNKAGTASITVSGTTWTVVGSFAHGDSATLYFGDANDIGLAWDGTKFAITQAAANSAIHLGVSGAGIDLNLFGDTAGRDLTWDQSADSLIFADNAKLAIGTGSDIVFLWDGTDLLVSQATVNSAIKWGVDAAGIDHVFYGDTAAVTMTWDQSADSLIFADAAKLVLGTGSDDTIQHTGTNTTWVHTTGDLTFDNQLVTGSTIFLLGTDTTATDFQVQNNSAAAIFSVTPASATLGTTLVVGTLDVNGSLDLDFAASTTSEAASIAATVDSAAGVVSALSVSATTVTTAHTSGTIAAIKASVTSLAADTGGDFACMEFVSVDGGGTTPTHVGILCADPLDALVKVAADGDGGFVVGATMTVSPETTAESGYFKVAIGSTIYQVPIYAA